MRRASAAALLALVATALGTGCRAQPDPGPGQSAIPVVEKDRLAMFDPLPASAPGQAPTTEAAVTLGRMLYYDPRLSRSQTISCNTCHDLANYGVDSRPPTATGDRRGTATRRPSSMPLRTSRSSGMAAPPMSRSRRKGRFSTRSRWPCPGSPS